MNESRFGDGKQYPVVNLFSLKYVYDCGEKLWSGSRSYSNPQFINPNGHKTFVHDSYPNGIKMQARL